MRAVNAEHLISGIRRGLHGPHMLAFLPALCLASYWLGGEVLLIASALFAPLLYAAAGGFDRLERTSEVPRSTEPTVHEVAEDFLTMSRLNGQVTACIQIGIRGLEEITRSFGADAARDAGQLVRDRLRSALRRGDHVFQLADGRFVVFVAPGFRLRLDTLIDLANRLRNTVEEPLSVCGTARHVTMSVGIASSLNFGRNVTPDTWLASAAQALSEAVSSGDSTTRIWSEKMSRRINALQSLRQDLQAAFEKGELETVFRPQTSVLTGRPVGLQARARWNHPTAGTISAQQLSDTATESGLASQLGAVVRSNALAALIACDRSGLDVVSVSVPLSDQELRNPDLAQHVSAELDRTGLAGSRLAFELSARTFATGFDDLQRRGLASLAELECSIAVSGFGTGASSLTSLQLTRCRRIIIERGFVTGVHACPDTRRMLEAVVAMADRLGLETTAEDVRTPEEMGVLRDLGCSFARGPLVAEFMSLPDVLEWIRNHAAHRAAVQPARIHRIN